MIWKIKEICKKIIIKKIMKEKLIKKIKNINFKMKIIMKI